MRAIRLLTTIFAFIASVTAVSQDSSSVLDVSKIPSNYFENVSKKLNGLDQKLDQKTKQYLEKIERQERRLFKKLYKKDSVAAKDLFGNIEERYDGLRAKSLEQAKRLGRFSKVYSPRLDSLNVAFNFLNDEKILNPELKSKLNAGFKNFDRLQENLNQADQLKKLLKERKKLIAEQFEKFGLGKGLKQFNKQIYYFQAQVKEYKELLEDPGKLEAKVMDLLANIPAFRKFFNQNSQLAALFRLPGASSSSLSTSMAGLQTRGSLQQDITNRLGGGADLQRMIQENMRGAQNQVSQLKNELYKRLPGGGGTDEELPDFNPNNQKTKSFLQRIEAGTNFQTQKGTTIFPVTTDLGFSVGYKLNDKSIIGIGASYRMGWGSGWNSLRITHEGVGLRSFIDVKLKGNFFISGGYEQNYRAEIRQFDQLRDQSAWQQSGLIGLSKSVSSKSKFLKKSKVQILWDFLSYDNIPRSQPIIFRIGYTF